MNEVMMLDLFESNVDGVAKPGFRLSKVQLWNWGTFDSSQGKVHTIEPEGETTLLIGRNGSGKSTLVDALLTLLTPPGKRSYNVAAGSTGKKERDERSYIQGAYGHSSVSESHKAQTQYLRQGSGHYSVVLAQFINTGTEQSFTLAQMLYLNAQGRPERLFCWAGRLLNLEDSFVGITSMDKLKAQIRARGFEVSVTYTDYGRWFRKTTGMADKAMDVFNQTVAVKEIDSLDDFIRTHMLEKRNWRDTVNKVLVHFDQLTAAHAALVKAREELELLKPVETAAKAHEKTQGAYEKRQAEAAALEPWFAERTVILIEPLCSEYERKLESYQQQVRSVEVEVEELEEKRVQLEVDIRSSSDTRVQDLRRSIDLEQNELAQRRQSRAEVARKLQLLELGEVPIESAQWLVLQNSFDRLCSTLASERKGLENEQIDLLQQKGQQQRDLEELKAEHQALLNRRTQLPEKYQYLRAQLCEALHLQDHELPFAAELMAVQPEELEWETSIEKVLRTMALTLLVPEEHYAQVSRMIDSKVLKDDRGRGMRLHYERISTELVEENQVLSHSLLAKLEFRSQHPLAAWLRHRLSQRFNYRCCESVEEFQSERGAALTKNRHIKHGFSRHEKDDRSFVMRDFVLGWDNRRKIDFLRGEIGEAEDVLAVAKKEASRISTRIEQLRRSAVLIQSLAQVQYNQLDANSSESRLSCFQQELAELEQGNQKLQILQKQLAEVLVILKQQRAEYENLVEKRTSCADELARGKKMLEHAQKFVIDDPPSDEYAALEELLGGTDSVTLENLTQKQSELRELLVKAEREAAERLAAKVQAVERTMGSFLRRFTEHEVVLRAELACLPEFLARLRDIQKKDLPRHEKRFKDHLNEKVTQEIAVLNNKFRNEGRQIEGKIKQLNHSLSAINEASTSYMTLEVIQTKDREILEFRQGLKECLSGSFGAGDVPDEVRYQTMAKFIKRLKDEERWRDRVIDVRRWYHFAGVERDLESGEEINYYADTGGKSGGEKARFAFTVLVAAIGYQFNIDPGLSVSPKFHFVMVDEMFSKVDDKYAEYALNLFKRFGLQLLIVAPFDAKARITEPYVNHYLHVIKENDRSHLLSMTAEEVEKVVG